MRFAAPHSAPWPAPVTVSVRLHRDAMPCALCLRDVELRDSHVIPEFVYGAVYDELHRFHEIQITEPDKPRIRQKGLRERLLCEDCEGRLGVHERYVSLVFSGAIVTTSQRSGNLVTVSGLDYTSFKLFGLSILWRASVSTLPFFQEVNLGKYEEVTRLALLNGDPGPHNRLSVMINGLSVDDEPFYKLIVEPTRSKIDGHTCYRFVFGSLIWVFVVSGHALSETMRQVVLNEQGTFKMLISELRDVTFLARQLETLQEHWNKKDAT